MTHHPRDPDFPKPPRWAELQALYAQYTCPASRQVVLMTEALRRFTTGRDALANAGYNPDHWASSMEATVKALWEARAELAKLRGKGDDDGRA